LQAPFVPRRTPLRTVEPILESTFEPRVGHENLVFTDRDTPGVAGYCRRRLCG